MNLFFIHTPIQMLVAQNLIIKKRLQNNIVVLGNTGKGAAHFYNIFEKMLISELWSFKHIIGDLDEGIHSFSRPFSSYIKLWQFSKKVKLIIAKHEIDALYFGDINHPAYIFLAEKWSATRLIYFFEEGLSNYTIPILKKKFNNSFVIRLKRAITDSFVYKSFGVNKFSKYNQSIEDCNFGFPIAGKYNILPLIENQYDEIIKFDIYLSPEISNEIDKDLNDVFRQSKFNVLYLSTSATYLLSDPLKDEIVVLQNALKTVSAEFRLLVKFHPKDPAEKKAQLRSYFKESGIDYQEIFCDVAFPIEVIFDKIKIDYLLGYSSSSQLYFEVLHPEIPNYNLYHALTEYYDQNEITNKFSSEAWQEWKELYKNIFNRVPLEL